MFRARNTRLFVLLVLAGFPTAGTARTITQIIFGNTLDRPAAIAVDNR